MKKLLIYVLVLAMLALPLLTACGDSDDKSNAGTTSGTGNNGETNNGETENPLATFPLEEMKYDATINVLTRSGHHTQQFVYVEDSKSETINKAVKDRNELIQEKYGITIEVIPVNLPLETLQEDLTSDLQTYHIVSENVYNMTQKITEGYFYSLNDLLQLNQPWWDQNVNFQLTLSDKIFFVAGNATYTDDLYTACILYNKTAYATQYESAYGSIYDLVDDGKWTIDLMTEMAKEFAHPDESGQWMTTGAYYGVVTDGYTGATMLTNGSGAVSAYKDEQNNIQLSGGSEASVNAFDKVYQLLNDTTVSVYAEQFKPTDWNYGGSLFLSNQAMFQVTYIGSLLGIMTNESANKVVPGAVPIPKYDEAQEKYHSGINVYQSTVMAIPVSNRDFLEETTYAMELMGYYSMMESQFGKDSVTAAFYETSLKMQSVDTDDDSRMLDLITSNRIYDLGGAFNWGGNLIGLYSSNLYKGANTLASTWDANLDGVKIELQKTIDAWKSSIN